MYFKNNLKIYIAGHTGLLGSAIYRRLKAENRENLLIRTHNELDLMSQADVESFFNKEKPEYVILTAAKVGGIHANSLYPAQFIFENLSIQNNVIHASYLYGVKKLLFFGSACSYPRDCPQPMSEDDLLSGYLEPTNESYAIAKIAGIKMCQAYNRQYGTNFICAVPTNVYGPNDNFDPIDSHVIPALLRKFYDAKRRNAQEVIIWGTGNPTREFIYSDDLADACVFLMEYYDDAGMINIGSGEEITIKDLSYLISDIVGYDGYIIFDSSKPDGMPRKVLNSSKLKRLGWAPRVSLREGLQETNNWYLKNEGKLLKTWTEKTPRY